ncbi:MAG: Na+/H+ antiporter NhaA [Thermincola sp.]|jgi:NhaA family Na+:H+ antiporter|nr:Na+/H+ antiporter NhaA [Thermincola sp.]MDT3702045.1 Na+/H+ antiporter NhaA [Thermincola sp.]
MHQNKTLNLLQEFSIPLIVGIFAALIWANISPLSYREFIEKELFFGVNFHFLVNDVFMVFFFAIAGVEITQSLMPGGDLNPLRKAVNPLLATLGGVLGPALVYISLNHFFGAPVFTKGWGIPTATDIALAWLTARFVFGSGHPAVRFLLLLAVADDAIGLLIIAIFYPDPLHPTEPIWLLLNVAALVIAYLSRKFKVRSYLPYLLTAGPLSWVGLHNAHLHPALALIFVIPFLPHPVRQSGHLFEESKDEDKFSTLAHFEHQWSPVVDFGLFFFGLTNAGVQFSGIGTITWLVFIALLVGKTGGIYLLANIAQLLGFPLPDGMGRKEVFVAGLIAAMGLTVALFVAGAAFTKIEIQGAAKMGALFSAGSALIAFLFAKLIGIKKIVEKGS